MKTVREANNAHFWAGMIMYIALHSIFQDLRGLEKVLEMTRANWMPWYITLPLSLFLLLLAIMLMCMAGKVAKKYDN